MKDVKHIIIFAIIAAFCLTGCGLAVKKADFFSVRERKLGREVKEKMPALGEDYAKVSWERVYGISREYPGIVISTATFENKPFNYLIIAVSNVNDTTVLLSGDVEVLADTGAVVGLENIYEREVTPGNTILVPIFCGIGDRPNGKVRWRNVSFKDSGSTAVPWTAEWEIRHDPHPDAGAEDLIGDVHISLEGEVAGVGSVDALLLDKEGRILSYGCSFIGSDKTGCRKVEDELRFFTYKYDEVNDMALFADFKTYEGRKNGREEI